MGVVCYHCTKVRAKSLRKGDRVPQFRGGRHHNYEAGDAVERLDENEVPDSISKLASPIHS